MDSAGMGLMANILNCVFATISKMLEVVFKNTWANINPSIVLISRPSNTEIFEFIEAFFR